MDEQLGSGIFRAYSKGELLERLPWKKSQLTIILQELVTEGILEYKSRKYWLNIKNSLVKRVKKARRYQFNDIEWAKMLQEFQFDKKVEKEEEFSGEAPLYRKITKKELEKFIQEIYNVYENAVCYFQNKDEQIKELAKFLEEKILLTIGIITVQK